MKQSHIILPVLNLDEGANTKLEQSITFLSQVILESRLYTKLKKLKRITIQHTSYKCNLEF